MNTSLSAFDTFPLHARTWVYQSSRTLTEDEISLVGTLANAFVKDWKAHGQPLMAAAAVLYNRFLVIMVDEDAAHASGCSIDSSVAFIRSLQNRLSVDFMERIQLAYISSSNAVMQVHVNQLETAFAQGELNANTTVFNNMVVSHAELQSKWRIPLAQSWAATRVGELG